MNTKFARVLWASLLSASFVLAPTLKADEWDRKTEISFSAPVEVPGVVLAPGRYVFKLMDSQSNRNIVQIFSDDEKHLYATVLAIPTYRMNPPDKTLITFEERPAGSPEAVHEWFYPGDQYGEEFIYGKGPGKEVAMAQESIAMTPAPPSTPESLAAPQATVEQEQQPQIAAAPSISEMPESTETEIAQATPPAQEQAAPTPVETSPASTMPTELPHTASSIPLMGLAGLASVGAALGLHAASKRIV
jgi:hypothetical protein